MRDVVAADDIGQAIHPVLAEGQVEGGTLQAVGYATIEEIKLVDGRYLNDRLATYLIPTALDAPRITRSWSRSRSAARRTAPRASASCRWTSVAPAVVAAIHDATGVWIHDLPATPERILAALHGIAAAAGHLDGDAAQSRSGAVGQRRRGARLGSGSRARRAHGSAADARAVRRMSR